MTSRKEPTFYLTNVFRQVLFDVGEWAVILPDQLEKMLGIGPAMYAIDITICTFGGSVGELQGALQDSRCRGRMRKYIQTLSAAPEKSEHLMIDECPQRS